MRDQFLLERSGEAGMIGDLADLGRQLAWHLIDVLMLAPMLGPGVKITKKGRR